MTDTTIAFDAPLTTDTLRTRLANRLTNSLAGSGYIVEARLRGDLEVSKDGLVVGRVDLRNVYVSRDGDPIGEVTVRGTAYDSKQGRYKLNAIGTVNTVGILLRLQKETEIAQRRAVLRAASDLRLAEDAAILQTLTGDQTVDHGAVTIGSARVQVFQGAVDIKLTDLTPEQAAAVLAVLGGA